MFRFIGLCLGTLVRFSRARRTRLLENLALRQQLAVLKRRHPRPRLDLLDKLFWVAVRRLWSGWQQSVIVATPETVALFSVRIEFWRSTEVRREPKVNKERARDSSGFIAACGSVPINAANSGKF